MVSRTAKKSIPSQQVSCLLEHQGHAFTLLCTWNWYTMGAYCKRSKRAGRRPKLPKTGTTILPPNQYRLTTGMLRNHSPKSLPADIFTEKPLRGSDPTALQLKKLTTKLPQLHPSAKQREEGQTKSRAKKKKTKRTGYRQEMEECASLDLSWLERRFGSTGRWIDQPHVSFAESGCCHFLLLCACSQFDCREGVEEKWKMASSSLGRALRSGLRLSNQRLASAVQRRTYYDERYPWTHPVAPKSASQVAYTIDFPERSAVAILDVNWEKLPQSEKDKVDPLIRAGKLYITRDDLYFFELPVSRSIPPPKWREIMATHCTHTYSHTVCCSCDTRRPSRMLFGSDLCSSACSRTHCGCSGSKIRWSERNWLPRLKNKHVGDSMWTDSVPPFFIFFFFFFHVVLYKHQ